MAIALNYHHLEGAIFRLFAGARLYVVEQKPYPGPLQVVIVQDEERYRITYNEFAILLTAGFMRSLGLTRFDDFPAEVYIYWPGSESI